MPKTQLLVIALGDPILGIYHEGVLRECIALEDKISQSLSVQVEPLLQNHNINHLIYTNGPGNFLGIKLAYVFLKTLSLARGIALDAIDGFALNGNLPIKSVMGQCFVKHDNEIVERPFDAQKDILGEFRLPQTLSVLEFRPFCEPQYITPAVY